MASTPEENAAAAAFSSGVDAMLSRSVAPETSSSYVTHERSSGAPSRLDEARCTYTLASEL
eukprot:6469682-Prymnesium_polylepis.2